MDIEYPTVEVGAHTYRIGKLDAFAQLHVARKLAPLLTGLQKVSELSLDDALPPILNALSQMPDSDVEYVMVKCLSVVQRALPAGVQGWQPIWNSAAKRTQFEDIDLAVMIQLAGQVITRNLGGFLGALGPAIGSPSGTPAAS